MSDPVPRRRLTRFSLLALIVATNVCGLFVWANFRIEKVEFPNPRFKELGLIRQIRARGWPFTFSKVDISTSQSGLAEWRYDVMPSPEILALSANILIGVLGTVGSVLVVEELRKFRKAKRHDG